MNRRTEGPRKVVMLSGAKHLSVFRPFRPLRIFRGSTTGLLFVILHSLFPIPYSFAAIPMQINHQGVIKVSGNPFNGSGDFRFALVDPDTGQNRWTNDGSKIGIVGTPNNAVSLPVINGIYNVRLGDASLTNMVVIPTTVFNDDNIVLRIWFSDGVNGIQQLAPDQPITSSPYAFHALNAEIATTALTATNATNAASANSAVTAITAANGVPSGRMILDVTSTAPAGFTYTGRTIQAAENGWYNKEPLPGARRHFGIAVVGNRIFAIGGRGGDVTCVKDNAAYDPVSNTWTSYADMPTARSAFGMGVVNGRIYAVGGNTPSSTISTNEEFDPITNTWTTKAPMNGNRDALAAGSVGDRMFAIGGFTLEPGRTVLSRVEEYNPTSDAWTPKADMPTARSWLAAAVLNGKIYAIGGMDNGENVLANNEEYDPSTNSWSVRASMPTARCMLGIGVIGSELYAMGGAGRSGGGYFNSDEIYRPQSDIWGYADPLPTPRSKLGVAGDGTKIYAIGGEDATRVSAVNQEYALAVFFYVHQKN